MKTELDKVAVTTISRKHRIRLTDSFCDSIDCTKNSFYHFLEIILGDDSLILGETERNQYKEAFNK